MLATHGIYFSFKILRKCVYKYSHQIEISSNQLLALSLQLHTLDYYDTFSNGLKMVAISETLVVMIKYMYDDFMYS